MKFEIAALLCAVAGTCAAQGTATTVKECPAVLSDFLSFPQLCVRPATANIHDPNRLLQCEALTEAGLTVLYPGDARYEDSVKSYWSKVAQVYPSCIVQPYSATEVATAVIALVKANKTQPCQFAVRSGGHTTLAGAANIEEGVTIDLGMMNSTTYHAETNTATVLPGARWGSVYEVLDPLKVAVAGGRAPSVGVGGLVLGGGNSFYAARKGMVCDNVVQFEVVTGRGEIIYANNKTNGDLFRALKGGSNNFGIVTRLDLVTFEGGNLWGGVITYPNSTTPQQLQALVNFNNKIEEDPYGSVISIFRYSTFTGSTIVINAYEYTKPIEKPAVFDEFYAISGQISNTMRITSMTDITNELELNVDCRVVFMTLTFENDLRILQKGTDLQSIAVGELSSASGDWTMHIMFQPLPPVFAKHSVERGGNVLGLDRSSKSLVLFQLYLAWNGKKQDDFFESIGKRLIGELDLFAQSIGKGNPYKYLPYASPDQKPLESYGKENVEKIRAAAQKYDPEGVFQTMVPGGFKISKVHDEK